MSGMGKRTLTSMKTLAVLGVLGLLGAWAAPAVAAAPAAPDKAVQDAAPTREDLRAMLLHPDELAAHTKTTWVAKPAPAGDSPASTTGCAGLDNAVLASNTGLVDSGPVDYLGANGDLIEQNIAHDPQSAQHVRELATGIADCPAMTFDGMSVPIKPMDLGSDVAAFRVFIGGQSRSAVLTASHGDYVVELITSDHGFGDGYFQSLLDLAYNRLDAAR